MEALKEDVKDVSVWVSVQIVKNKKLLEGKGVTKEKKENVKVVDRLLKDISFRLMKIMKKDYEDEYDGIEEEEEEVYESDSEDECDPNNKEEDFIEELVEESDIESDLE